MKTFLIAYMTYADNELTQTVVKAETFSQAMTNFLKEKGWDLPREETEDAYMEAPYADTTEWGNEEWGRWAFDCDAAIHGIELTRELYENS